MYEQRSRDQCPDIIFSVLTFCMNEVIQIIFANDGIAIQFLIKEHIESIYPIGPTSIV